MSYPIRFVTAATVLFAIFLFSLPTASVSAEQPSQQDVKVIVYEGPQPPHCTPPTDDRHPTSIQPDHTVGLHFTVTIDESSAAGTVGRQVESSSDRGFAPSFVVGRGKVIPGLDRGLIGLCKGSKAYIIVAPHLAYGQQGVPEQNLPGGVTLRYDVEILDIQPPVPNEFGKIDRNDDWRLSREEAKAYFDRLGQPIDLDGLWKAEDANGDGYISWEEFTGPKGSEGPPAPHPNSRKQQRQQQQQQKKNAKTQQANPNAESVALFQQVAGADGKITKSELADFFASVGQEMSEEFWKESDSDGDGYVDLREWLGDNAAGRGSEL